MCCACDHVQRMSKMIQIRNVPDDVHRKVKVRAAQEGMTLSDYLLREVTLMTSIPTRAELRERLERLPPIDADQEIVDVIRADRESR
jgi:hypothetical protein